MAELQHGYKPSLQNVDYYAGTAILQNGLVSDKKISRRPSVRPSAIQFSPHSCACVVATPEIARWEIFFEPPADWPPRQQVEAGISVEKHGLTICLGDRP